MDEDTEIEKDELYDILGLPNKVVDFYESFSEAKFGRAKFFSQMYFSHKIVMVFWGVVYILFSRTVEFEGSYEIIVLGLIYAPFILVILISYPHLVPFGSDPIDEKSYLNTLTLDFALTLYFYKKYKQHILEDKFPKQILRDRKLLNGSNGFMRQSIWLINTPEEFREFGPNILYHQYLNYSSEKSDIEKKQLITTEYINKISSDNAKDIAKQLNLHYQRDDKDVALMLLRNMFEVYYEDIFINSLTYSTPEFRKSDDYNTSLGSLMAWSEDKKDYYNGRVVRAKNELENVKDKCETKIHSEKKYDEIITNLKEEDEFITQIENVIDALETIEVKEGH